MVEDFPRMQPRDVVAPSATILAFIITAFGIIVTLADEAQQLVVKNFALILITVVILFVSAVSLTALSSLVEKQILWRASLAVYAFGWFFLGTVTVITLVGYGYGIEALQIQLPQYNAPAVNISAFLVSAICSFLLRFFYEYLKKRVRKKEPKSRRTE